MYKAELVDRLEKLEGNRKYQTVYIHRIMKFAEMQVGRPSRFLRAFRGVEIMGPGDQEFCGVSGRFPQRCRKCSEMSGAKLRRNCSEKSEKVRKPPETFGNLRAPFGHAHEGLIEGTPP